MCVYISPSAVLLKVLDKGMCMRMCSHSFVTHSSKILHEGRREVSFILNETRNASKNIFHNNLQYRAYPTHILSVVYQILCIVQKWNK